MAKTIKERSIDYRKEQWKSVSPSGYGWCDSHIEQAYIEGANAVHDEIEKLIEQVKYYSDHSASSMLYRNLVETIKELKAL